MIDAIATVDTIESFIEPASVLVDECKLHFQPDEVRIRAVDPANVAMVDTALRASAFESYEGDGETIALNLNQFEDVLGLGDSSDLIHLELDQEVRKLDIEIGETDYTQALINPQSVRSEPDIPELDLPNVATLACEDLEHAVTATDLVSDHIQIKVGDVPNTGDRVLAFKGEGDTDDVTTSYDEDALLDSRLTEASSSLFSLDYVTDIVGAVPDDGEVQLTVGSAMPIDLDWSHTEGHANVHAMISPRVGGDA